MGPDKIDHLVTRYPDTHLALAKWDQSLDPLRATVTTAARSADRTAPIDLLRFPPDSADRFVDDRGRISVSHDDVTGGRMQNEAT